MSELSGDAAVQRSFAADVSSVGAARRFVEEALTSWRADELSWAATLLVTELATNAVLHAATTYLVGLDLRGDGTLRIGVSDGSVRKPRPREYGVDATTGRGLALVDALSAAWGTSAREGGKTVWCDVKPDPAEVEGEPDLDAFLSDEDIDLASPPSSSSSGSVQVRWLHAA